MTSLVRNDIHPVIIVGAGAAGLTAAIYTARAHLNPIVIRGPKPGGQLSSTSTVENYPGFVNGVLGPALMEFFEAQAERFEATLISGTVTDVDLSQRPFRLKIDDRQWLYANAVIIATGATPKYLGLENEKNLIGRGVSTCATCDGCFFQDQVVAVIGGGDAAMENALFLTRFASQIYVVHRRDSLRASQVLQSMALQHEKISFLWNTQVQDILGETEVEAVRLQHHLEKQETTLPVQGVFVAIGHRPNSGAFRQWIDTDRDGYILTREGSTYTNIDGVFACGDVQDSVYRQAVTAAGSGCMAAIDAERWLRCQRGLACMNMLR